MDRRSFEFRNLHDVDDARFEVRLDARLVLELSRTDGTLELWLDAAFVIDVPDQMHPVLVRVIALGALDAPVLHLEIRVLLGQVQPGRTRTNDAIFVLRFCMFAFVSQMAYQLFEDVEDLMAVRADGLTVALESHVLYQVSPPLEESAAMGTMKTFRKT